MPLTVEQARSKRVCRICEKPILENGPPGWDTEFQFRNYPPPKIILFWGKEFAHEQCLKEQENPVMGSTPETPAEGKLEFTMEDAKKDDVSGLTQLGSKQTDYSTKEPSAKMLETFLNIYPARSYDIIHTSDEFTSLCPKTGQPDFAKIRVQIIPDTLCLESKSFKLYLFAYRNVGSFMETICNRILEDIVSVIKPRSCNVTMIFHPRGGVTTEVSASHWSQPQGYMTMPPPTYDKDWWKEFDKKMVDFLREVRKEQTQLK